MIKVYTTPVCPWCHALMDWLDQQGIKYEEVDASTMPGISAVPVTEINGERIVGFDRPAIKEALAKLPTDSADDEATSNSEDSADELPKAA